MEKEGAVNCLQQRRMIHESVRRKEREECHAQLAQGGLVGHQHSLQMAHRGNGDGKQGETVELGIDGSQKVMVVRNRRNI